MSDFETRKRPLRDTVCDIDADIINLIMRRHNMLTRMAGREKNPGSQDEKMIREDWEARVAKVCQQQTGMSLHEYAQQLRDSESQTPGMQM